MVNLLNTVIRASRSALVIGNGYSVTARRNYRVGDDNGHIFKACSSSPSAAILLGISHGLALRPPLQQRGGGVVKFCSSSSMPTTDNVTYSGGQEGVQGGFYGSGGARAHKSADGEKQENSHRPGAVASMEDVKTLKRKMEEVVNLETQLEALDNQLSPKGIELKAQLQKLLVSPAFQELIKRMELNNEPIWGLTTAERELVKYAKSKAK